MTTKSATWRPGATVCRCCLAEGCYKDIATEYFWMGKREVYSEMLNDTFDVSIAYSQAGGPNSNSRLICEPCISRLRDASEFKRQVQECEKTFMQYLEPGSSATTEVNASVDSEKDVKLEDVKQEKEESDEDYGLPDDFPDDDGDDDDDIDDQPLTKLASKIPKKEEEAVDLLDFLDPPKVAEKRKSAAKAKSSPAKKAKTTEAKASVSKVKSPPEKKKKEDSQLADARKNALIIVRCTTAYPFRIPGLDMLCVFCCETYNDPAEYRLHMKKDHKVFNVKVAFNHYNAYENYIKVDCTELCCRLCSEPLNSLEDAAKHLYYKHDKGINLNVGTGLQMFKFMNEKWICAHCPTKLSSLRELSRHTSSHYHNYTCDICGKSYVNKIALIHHSVANHTDGVTCVKCKAKFSSKELRRKHVLASKRCWPYICMFCPERFLHEKNKIDHLQVEHGQKKRVIICSECGEEFQKRYHYRNHFKLCHSDGYVCTCCGLKHLTKRDLEEHVDRKSGNKKYKCDICYKTFVRRSNLQQHAWTHKELKRFKCSTCDKQFSVRFTLNSHMKKCHPESAGNTNVS